MSQSSLKAKEQTPTKGEIPKLLATLNVVAFVDGSLDATHHHRTHAHRHHAPKLRRVNGDDLPRILAVYIQGRTNCLGLLTQDQIPISRTKDGQWTHIDSVILPSDVRHLPDRPLHRRVESMIVLGRKPEDCKRATVVLVCLRSILLAEESGDGELAAFDPQTSGFRHGFECHEAAVGGADEAVRVIGSLDWAGRGFEFPGERVSGRK